MANKNKKEKKNTVEEASPAELRKKLVSFLNEMKNEDLTRAHKNLKKVSRILIGENAQTRREDILRKMKNSFIKLINSMSIRGDDVQEEFDCSEKFPLESLSFDDDDLVAIKEAKSRNPNNAPTEFERYAFDLIYHQIKKLNTDNLKKATIRALNGANEGPAKMCRTYFINNLNTAEFLQVVYEELVEKDDKNDSLFTLFASPITHVQANTRATLNEIVFLGADPVVAMAQACLKIVYRSTYMKVDNSFMPFDIYCHLANACRTGKLFRDWFLPDRGCTVKIAQSVKDDLEELGEMYAQHLVKLGLQRWGKLKDGQKVYPYVFLNAAAGEGENFFYPSLCCFDGKTTTGDIKKEITHPPPTLTLSRKATERYMRQKKVVYAIIDIVSTDDEGEKNEESKITEEKEGNEERETPNDNEEQGTQQMEEVQGNEERETTTSRKKKKGKKRTKKRVLDNDDGDEEQGTHMQGKEERETTTSRKKKKGKKRTKKRVLDNDDDDDVEEQGAHMRGNEEGETTFRSPKRIHFLDNKEQGAEMQGNEESETTTFRLLDNHNGAHVQGNEESETTTFRLLDKNNEEQGTQVEPFDLAKYTEEVTRCSDKVDSAGEEEMQRAVYSIVDLLEKEDHQSTAVDYLEEAEIDKAWQEAARANEIVVEHENHGYIEEWESILTFSPPREVEDQNNMEEEDLNRESDTGSLSSPPKSSSSSSPQKKSSSEDEEEENPSPSYGDNNDFVSNNGRGDSKMTNEKKNKKIEPTTTTSLIPTNIPVESLNINDVVRKTITTTMNTAPKSPNTAAILDIVQETAAMAELPNTNLPIEALDNRIAEVARITIQQELNLFLKRLTDQNGATSSLGVKRNLSQDSTLTKRSKQKRRK